MEVRKKEALQLQHNRILQAMAIKFAVLVGLIASVSLISTQVGLSAQTLVYWNETLIIYVGVWVYVIYAFDTLSLINIENELGGFEKYKIGKFRGYITMAMLVCLFFMTLLIFYIWLVYFQPLNILSNVLRSI